MFDLEKYLLEHYTVFNTFLWAIVSASAKGFKEAAIEDGVECDREQTDRIAIMDRVSVNASMYMLFLCITE